ncbi:MAG: SDR family oxidoreductase [Syntrophothermus sp.]
MEQKTKKPVQQQPKPGKETRMHPEPRYDYPGQKGSGKLLDKVALITGGDSGIGRAVAILFAKEGARVAISYLDEHEDAEKTRAEVEKYGGKCLLLPGDIGSEEFCFSVVNDTVRTFGRIDILVNNAGIQTEAKHLEDISSDQLIKTFTTNIFSFFWMTKAALPHMKEGSAIVNSTSVTAYRGSSELMDYASTKGAILAFTRSLSQNLVKQKIRVNAVAPGPVWTPLIISSFDEKKISEFGKNVPMERAGEPVEIAPSYLFLACNDSSFMTGQVLHPNGGEVNNA